MAALECAKVARNDGVIDIVPATPRAKAKDNPRPFLDFIRGF